MRSIGKKNINLVRQKTIEVLKASRPEEYVFDKIRDSLPLSLWDTWESADDQINMIIMDTMSSYS